LTGEGQGGGDFGNFFTASGRGRVGVKMGFFHTFGGGKSGGDVFEKIYATFR
jgi:hypothetical protein